MKKNIFIFLLLTILISCKKEKFPDIDDLNGAWTEQTDNSFKNKLNFNQTTLYFMNSDTTDSYLYTLDKKKGRLHLRIKSNSSTGESSHKIQINRKGDVLTIWGLFSSIPEQTTITKFAKD